MSERFQLGHATGTEPGQGFMGPACGGMTLADWFAGQALVGIILRDETMPDIKDGELTLRPIPFSSLAARAYLFAGAMLAERERRGKEQPL
jgi:hypothetical protein